MINGKSSSMSVGRPMHETALHKERGMNNAIFRSTTDRFNLSYSAANPGIRILKSHGGKR